MGLVGHQDSLMSIRCVGRGGVEVSGLGGLSHLVVFVVEVVEVHE